MKKEGKNWGSTAEIIKNPFVEIHRIEVKKGGTCSIHIHSFKINAFIVESGKLLIKQFRDNGIIDETILSAGDILECLPNEQHQFIALEETVAYEAYYPISIGGVDITRYSVGFIDDSV